MTCDDCNRHGPYEDTFAGDIMRHAQEIHRLSHQGGLPIVPNVPDPDNLRHRLAVLTLDQLALHRREDHP